MALPAPLAWVRRVYRWLHRGWDSRRVQHLVATALVIILLLVVEVIGLVFGLTGTPGRTLGRQFEILSLILLRQSLKELVHAPEPLQWEALRPFVWPID